MYDLIIIGAGVAGMTASIYASRYRINHLIFGQTPGGQGNLASVIENYPGFPSVNGPILMQEFVKQVENSGAKILQKEIDKLVRGGDKFEVFVEREKYETKTLILAMGASYRNLGISGEKELVGKGVGYCTTCDAPLFKNKTVAVIGGGDTAITGAIHAAAFASKVYLIHRRDEFRAEPVWIEKMKNINNIEQVLSTQVKEIKGVNKVESIVLDKAYKGENELKVDGVFIEIGQVPSSSLVSELGVEMEERGYVLVTPKMETNIAGVYAAGDLALIKEGLLFRQLVTSAADGARAAASVYEYLHKSSPAPVWENTKRS